MPYRAHSTRELMMMMINSRRSLCKIKKNTLRLLPKDFQPSPYTVVVGNSSKAMTKNVPGIQYFYDLVARENERYHRASRRGEKSSILSIIYDSLQEKCKGSNPFVQCDGKGTWWELGEQAGREKISANFRNLMGNQYKSFQQCG